MHMNQFLAEFNALEDYACSPPNSQDKEHIAYLVSLLRDFEHELYNPNYTNVDKTRISRQDLLYLKAQNQMLIRENSSLRNKLAQLQTPQVQEQSDVVQEGNISG